MEKFFWQKSLHQLNTRNNINVHILAIYWLAFQSTGLDFKLYQLEKEDIFHNFIIYPFHM